MSALVEFPLDLYDENAFAKFSPETNFRIENALAMMWFSQLAYETGQPETIDNAKLIWQFDSIKTVAKHVHFQSSTKSHRKFSLDTRGVIGTKGDLMVIGFGGTDALVWENIATGIDFLPDTETIFLGRRTSTMAIRDSTSASWFDGAKCLICSLLMPASSGRCCGTAWLLGENVT